MEENKNVEEKALQEKQKLVFAILGFSIGILAVVAYLFVGYYMFASARLISFIGIIILCASSICWILFGFDHTKKSNLIYSVIGLILSLNVSVSVLFEIITSYIL